MQTFLCDGDQDIGGYGNPDLRLDGVLAGAKEHLDAQMLLDPFEEQYQMLCEVGIDLPRARGVLPPTEN